jgi:hypothetical protein
MAEEGMTTENTASLEAITRRLDRFEQEYLRESRWWRGGLIAALAVLAIVILIGAFHRPRALRDFGPMAMAGPMGMRGPMGMQGPMRFPEYGPPPPPPPWAYGYGPGYGFAAPYGIGPGDNCHRYGWWFERRDGFPGGPATKSSPPPPPPPSGGPNG